VTTRFEILRLVTSFYNVLVLFIRCLNFVIFFCYCFVRFFSKNNLQNEVLIDNPGFCWWLSNGNDDYLIDMKINKMLCLIFFYLKIFSFLHFVYTLFSAVAIKIFFLGGGHKGDNH